jgi:hypothetical protein
MEILDHSLFQRARRLTLALTLLSFAVAGCASRESRVRQEPDGPTRQAQAFLAKARHTQDTSARIGLILAAADKASQGIAEGNAPEARTLYNTACAELAILLRESPSAPALPATFATPAGTYVLKFDNARNTGRWDPTYFTKLLTPAELKGKAFVAIWRERASSWSNPMTPKRFRSCSSTV